ATSTAESATTTRPPPNAPAGARQPSVTHSAAPPDVPPLPPTPEEPRHDPRRQDRRTPPRARQRIQQRLVFRRLLMRLGVGDAHTGPGRHSARRLGLASACRRGEHRAGVMNPTPEPGGSREINLTAPMSDDARQLIVRAWSARQTWRSAI